MDDRDSKKLVFCVREQNSIKSKGSIGLAFTVRARTGSPDQASLGPYALHEISVLVELALGHLRYRLTDVPPQSNSPPESFLGSQRQGKGHDYPKATTPRYPQTCSGPIYASHFNRVECGDERNSGISIVGLRLPLMLHFQCLRTNSD